jgi:hypothetical protein
MMIRRRIAAWQRAGILPDLPKPKRRPATLPGDPAGSVVYVAQDTKNGWIKIGHSSNLERRLLALRSQPQRKSLSSHCGPLVALASFPAESRLERALSTGVCRGAARP